MKCATVWQDSNINTYLFEDKSTEILELPKQMLHFIKKCQQPNFIYHNITE